MLYALQRICIAILFVHVSASGSFSDVTDGNVWGDISGVIATLGDWDSDHYVDSVVARKNEIMVLSGDGGHVLEEFSLSCATCVVSNIIAGDINHDGLMDLLVQYRDPTNDEYLQNTVFLQPPNDDPLAELQLPLSLDHFLAANLFGKLHIDFVGTLVFNASDEVVTRSAIIRNEGCEKELQGCTPRFDCYLNTTGLDGVIPGCTWVNSTSAVNQTFPLDQAYSKLGDHSITDLDGDCSADIVLSFEGAGDSFRSLVLLETVPDKTVPFKLPDALPSIKVAREVGFITWYDVDQDGDMDMIAPLCSAGVCEKDGLRTYDSVVVVKNLQRSPGCSGYSCCNKRSFSFPDVSSIASIQKEEDGIKVTKLGGLLVDTQHDAQVYGAGAVFPHVVRLGDIDNDGDVDILLTVAYSDGPTTELWKGEGSGGFKLVGSAANAITRVRDSRVGFFYDLHKDGMLDVIVLSVSDGVERVHILENNIHETNHLFFKPLGLNGKCMKKCSGTPHNPDPEPYGVNMPGASHKIFFKVPKTMSSRNVYSEAVQLSQSQYLALQNPFSFFGLGNTNSYIETYFCGYHIAGVRSGHKSWPALLPNSEIIVINHPITHPSDWTIEMYIRPSKYVKWIIAMTCMTLVALGIPIAVLRYQELKQDALERLLDKPMMPM